MNSDATFFTHPLKNQLPFLQRGFALRLILVGLMLWPLGHTLQAQGRVYLLNELLPIDSQTGDILYLGTVPLTGVSEADLLSRAKRFFHTTLGRGSLPESVDEAKHGIRGRGILPLRVGEAGGAQVQLFGVSFELKVMEGRYRYQLSEFKAQPDSSGNGIPLGERYPPTQAGKGYDEDAARLLQAWDRSVRAYIVQLQGALSGQALNR